MACALVEVKTSAVASRAAGVMVELRIVCRVRWQDLGQRNAFGELMDYLHGKRFGVGAVAARPNRLLLSWGREGR